MRPVKPGTGCPAGSRVVPWTAGLIAAPATVMLGCWVKASWLAVPGMMSNAVLVTGANPLALAGVGEVDARIAGESGGEIAQRIERPDFHRRGDEAIRDGRAGLRAERQLRRRSRS